MVWIIFLTSAAIIVAAGSRLTVSADKLCARLGLGDVWIGIVLLGLITSMPEAVSSLIAVVSLGAGDLALGNLLGSNNFNPLLLVVMDFVYRKGSVTSRISPKPSHGFSAGYAIVLTVLVVFDIFASRVWAWPSWNGITVSLGALALIYTGGMYHLSRCDGAPSPHGIKERDTPETTGAILMTLMICAFCVVIASIWLTNSCDQIAAQTGLGQTFVGSLLLAMVTSLPEMVVTLSAMSLKNFDMAIGNIFGSNMTNMLILVICAAAAPGQDLMSTANPNHILTGINSIVMVAIILIGLRSAKKKTFWGVGWDTLLMLTAFLGTNFLLYLWR